MYRNLVFVSCCLVGVLAVSPKYEENDIARGYSPKSMLENIVNSIMPRTGASSSHVLSLNLTNLLILVLLKALVFSIASIGAGAWKGGYHRSLDGEETEIFSNTDFLLSLGYLSGKPGNYECMQKVACFNPMKARQYSDAGSLLLQVAKTVTSVEDSETYYRQALKALQEGAMLGEAGGNCEKRYKCDSKT